MEEPPFGQAGGRVRVVCDRVDGGDSRGEGTNPLVGEPFGLLIGSDAVDFAAEHQLLRYELSPARNTVLSPSSTSTPIWPGVWPGTGTSVTSPASVRRRLRGNGPNGSGSSSRTVGLNPAGQCLFAM